MHYTNQKSLRTQLVLANPTVFDHFCTTPPAKPKGQHGIRIGLSSEDCLRGEAAVDETEQTLGDDHVHDEGRSKGGQGYLEVGEEAVTIKKGGQGGQGAGGAPGFSHASSGFGRGKMN